MWRCLPAQNVSIYFMMVALRQLANYLIYLTTQVPILKLSRLNISYQVSKKKIRSIGKSIPVVSAHFNHGEISACVILFTTDNFR